MKKLFNIVLVALLLTTGSFTRIYAEPEDGQETGTDSSFVSWTEDYDPKALNVHYLGEITEDENEAEKAPYADGDIVRVSIVLKKPATLDVYPAENVADNKEAMAYRESLQSEQEIVTKDIENELNSELDVQWNLTLAANIISANVEYGDIDTIKNMDVIEDVFVETRYDVMEDDVNTSLTTEYMVGATDSWAAGYTGAGSRVAIIDTGTNQDHISFDPDAFEYSLQKSDKEVDLLDLDDINAVLPLLNQNNTASKHNIPSAEYVYKNSKIPFAFNYIDGNNTTDHGSDNQGEHGSHVSGIAAANRYIKLNGEYVEASASEYAGAVGVAPDAQILTMKVFGAGGGAYDSDYFAAIEDAIILGADSINLSLGSASTGFSFAGTYQGIMDGLVGSNSTVITSAGNSYNWSYFAQNIEYEGQKFGYLYLDDISEARGGSPGTYINSLGIAAAQNVGIVGIPLIYDNRFVFYTETSSTGAGIKTIPGTHDFVYIDGIGDPEEYATVNEIVSLEGKIVIVNRGGLSFYEKGNNVIEYNPAAVIIANNQAGMINMQLDGYIGSFPMISISLTDANYIKGTSESHETEDYTYYTGKIDVYDTVTSYVDTDRSDAEITDFSSWGIPGSLVMKPEITAPGGDIWSVNGMTDSEYESMSGTSMAAPHVTGMMAVLAQYIRENDLSEKTGLSVRTLMNSLLMSTATPMIIDGYYLPVLQQGSGLGDVNRAINADSYILMNEGATLSPDSVKDGKVKVELGQDADRSGKYSYSFSINNISDENLTYVFDTDIFTQDAFAFDGHEYLDTLTTYLNASVSYSYEPHDVNRDGVTDEDDVQALLDYITGNVSGDELDLDAGETDGVSGISSYDAQLLLQSIKSSGEEALLVPAGTSAQVSVSIAIDDPQLTSRDKGGYIEGFTYITCTTVTDEGVVYDDEHSIPILGYYGSWTDPGMLNPVSALDVIYPNDKNSYFETDPFSNYMEVQYPGSKEKYVYFGNPYVPEEEFPVERLAISGKTKITQFKETLIRNAATSAVVVLDENNNYLYGANEKPELYGAFYHVNERTWYNTSPTSLKLNKKVSDFGAEEGERILIGQFNVPEYYALLLDPNTKSGQVTAEQIAELYQSGELGEGSYLGYRMYIDDSAPVMKVSFNEETKTIDVEVADNNYVAYLALMDLNGGVYEDLLPEQNERNETITYSFDVSEIEEPGVVVFAGDYAANEKAVLVKISDEDIVIETKVYRLTDKLEAGHDYLIANSDKEGTAAVLFGYGPYYYVSSTNVEVLSGDDYPYVLQSEVEKGAVWTAYENGSYVSFDVDGELGFGYLGYLQPDIRYVVWPAADSADQFEYAGTNLLLAGTTYGMAYDSASFYFVSEPGDIYLYVEDTLVEKVDPVNASSIELSTYAATMVLGVVEEIEITADVQPYFIEDRTVTWTSSDESVATVDENGIVRAVALGEAVITATSNQTPSVTASAKVQVVDSEPMEGVYVFGQVSKGGEDYFAAIDLGDMSITEIGEAVSPLYGGTESGLFIYGNDTDNELHKYVITTDEDDNFTGIVYGEDLFTINSAFAMLDGANLPYFTIEVEDGDPIEFNYDAVGVTPNNYFAIYGMAEGNVRYFDLTGLDMLVGVAFAGLGTGTDEETGEEIDVIYYYMLGATGELYLWEMYGTDGGGFSANYYDLGKVNVLNIGDDLTAYSMVYGYTMTEEESIFVSDNTNQAIFYIDLSELADEYDARFVGKIDGSSNVSTLFDLAYDSYDGGRPVEMDREALKDKLINKDGALHSETGSLIAIEKVEEPVSEEAVGTETEGSVTVEELIVDADTSVEEPVFEEGPIVIDDPVEDDSVQGELNAIRNLENSNRSVIARNRIIFPENLITVKTDSQNPYSAIAIYSEDVSVKNGYVTVSYDPTFSKYIGYSSDIDFDSINVDTEKGLIRYAYAQLDNVDAGDTIVQFQFQRDCDDTYVTTKVQERNNELDPVDTSTKTIGGFGHKYYLAFWMWDDDYSGATAYFYCQRNQDHREKAYATVTKSVTEPTAERAGAIVYTAVAYFEGREYVDTRTIVLPATGHSYEFVGFEWSDDNSKAYAIFKDLTTGETRKVEASVSETRIEPTVDAEGSVTYTATVVYGGKTYTDSKTVKLDKLEKDEIVDPDKNEDDKSETTPEQKDDKKEDEVVPEEGKNADGAKTLSILDAIFCLATLGFGIYMALKGGFIGLLIAALSLIGFFMTQSLSGGLIVADKWSILLGGLMIINIIQAFFDKKFKK